MTRRPVFVTRPDLPPLEEFIPYLEKIWSSRTLTNEGPMHRAFEEVLCAFLGIEHVSVFCNGTIALLTALKVLGIQGEVITTPYSFVATSHALLWNNIIPVFVDIDERTCNIDAAGIEAAVTAKTTAILAVHCYGTPCDFSAIEDIAKRHDLRVIYDAAHAFAVKGASGSILRHGDLSVLSFHATKVFNTFEGGAIISPDAKTKAHVDHLKNFGFVDETTVVETGINGKMSEFNAAIGILQLKHFERASQQRMKIDALYREQLRNVIGVRIPAPDPSFTGNFGYFPIFIEPDYPLSRDELYQKLASRDIHARRYFFPLISEFPMYRNLPSAMAAHLPMATKIAGSVLCLPIYPDLAPETVDTIVQIIKDSSR